MAHKRYITIFSSVNVYWVVTEQSK